MQSNETSSMIRVSELVFRYRGSDFRLHVPDLEVARGSTVALVGASGSGKTTLLHLLAGILVPDSGKIETNGVEITRLDDAARRRFRIRGVGLVFQEFELLEYLNVLDNILLAYRIHPALRLDASVRERAAALARRVGIGDKLGRYVGRLSQGERQRVAVCRALLPEPSLLLADEPTGNLDPANREQVLDILFDYVRASGATLAAVTHDREILDRFERVIDFRRFHALPPGPASTAPAGGAR
jgi:ABC-type lipoprotein export system ATPase subunit